MMRVLGSMLAGGLLVASACAAPKGSVAAMPEASAPFASTLSSAKPAPPGACAAAGEIACLMEVIWEVSAELSEKKRDRLRPVFLETIAQSDDAALKETWRPRFSGLKRAAPAGKSFAMQQAEAVLAETDWNGFRQRARRGEAPFNIGRPEIMAAGVRLAPDPATARAILDDMFDLARPKTTRGGMGDRFEMGDFGHALAELSMQRCDLEGFDRALALTPEPDSLRYQFWRARITGQAGHLAPDIRHGGHTEDTRHVRNALEGITPIVKLGYCGS